MRFLERIKEKISDLRRLVTLAKKHGVSMRSKVLTYLCVLTLAGTGAFIFLLTAAGAFTGEARSMNQILELQLKARSRTMEEGVGYLAASAVTLSRRLTTMLEEDVLEYPYDISTLNDSPEKLLDAQEKAYPLIEGVLDDSRVSGAFMVLDATVNTAAPGAENSRSGLYLRLANVSSSSAPENDIFLFRGLPEVSREQHLQMHNRWNMEFDISVMSWYKDLLQAAPARFALEERHRLESTWEEAVFMSVPVRGSRGEAYGICGVEMSRLLFQLIYPRQEEEYGALYTVLAPLEENQLRVCKGLSNVAGGTLIDSSECLQIHEGKYFNTYSTGGREFIGLHKSIEILKGRGGKDWVVAVVMPVEGYHEYVAANRFRLLAMLGAFIAFMLLLANLMSRRFVRPILRSLEQLGTEEGERKGAVSTGIAELDAFLEALTVQRSSRNNGGTELPPDIEELFTKITERAGTLTPMEHTILNYYVEGYDIPDIPELACISLNTVRKHNRSIYSKLGINSNDELKLYIDLLKRCDRLHELAREQEESGGVKPEENS